MRFLRERPFCPLSTGSPGKITAPGGRKVSWFIWLWLFHYIPSLLSRGGIYGGVGQAIHMMLPFLASKCGGRLSSRRLRRG